MNGMNHWFIEWICLQMLVSTVLNVHLSITEIGPFFSSSDYHMKTRATLNQKTLGNVPLVRHSWVMISKQWIVFSSWYLMFSIPGEKCIMARMQVLAENFTRIVRKCGTTDTEERCHKLAFPMKGEFCVCSKSLCLVS